MRLLLARYLIAIRLLCDCHVIPKSDIIPTRLLCDILRDRYAIATRRHAVGVRMLPYHHAITTRLLRDRHARLLREGHAWVTPGPPAHAGAGAEFDAGDVLGEGGRLHGVRGVLPLVTSNHVVIT